MAASRSSSKTPLKERGRRTILLKLEYDGTDFAGWQLQSPGSRTVQGVVEDAIHTLTGERVRLKASGRTDAGVHALGQIAVFDTSSNLPLKKFRSGLNSIMPDDVKVLRASNVEYGFNPGKAAKSKTYRYIILNREPPSPLLINRAWHLRGILDIKKMKKAAKHLLGKRDFSSFRGARSAVKHSVRRITDVKIRTKSGNLVEIEVKGEGFLKHMVRAIVGTLVQVGQDKITPDDFKLIVEAKDRRSAGPTAPANGLYLVEVEL